MSLQKNFKDKVFSELKICGSPDRPMVYSINDIATSDGDLKLIKEKIPFKNGMIAERRKMHEIYNLQNHGILFFILKNGDVFVTDDSTVEFSENCPDVYMKDDYEGQVPEKYNTYLFSQCVLKTKQGRSGSLNYLAQAELMDLNGEDNAVCCYVPTENGAIKNGLVNQ